MTLALDRFSRHLQRWHSSRVKQNHRDLDWDIKARIKKRLGLGVYAWPQSQQPREESYCVLKTDHRSIDNVSITAIDSVPLSL